MSTSQVTPLLVATLALVGVVVTAAVSALVTLARVRRDLESQYDIALRNDRLTAYRDLWRSLQPLAKYAQPQRLDYRLVQRLSRELRAWYFETGGIFLTSRTRDAYFDLQDELRERMVGRPGDPAAELESSHFERLRQLGSALRTAMVDDVHTRRASALGRR